MTYFARSIHGGLLTAALLAAGTLPATAQDTPRGDWLFVTVTRGEVVPPALDPVDGGGVRHDSRSTLLLCDPPQGHARAADACAELAAVDGDIAALAPKDVHCPMVYAPVTARAHGEWNGRPVEYTQTFSNGCVMAARTGSVFALDT
jgi:hypothetical protein